MIDLIKENVKNIIYFTSLSLFAISCSPPNSTKKLEKELRVIRIENDSLKNIIAKGKFIMKNSIRTFLTFQDNNAENAMNFYVEIFEKSKIIEVKRWEKGGPVEEGKIMHATFELNGSTFMCSDSPPIHDWNFSPAVSNYIDCASSSEQERLFSKLSENGNITMPLNNYGFSKKFGWVIDQFGISWQLNLR